MRTEEQKQKTKELVSALRSGKYKQTYSKLTKNGAYCCLGVACIVAGREFSEYGRIEDTYTWLPQSVMDVFGFRTENGDFEPIETIPDKSLLSLNDETKWTFNQIADLIEKEPKGLFIE